MKRRPAQNRPRRSNPAGRPTVAASPEHGRLLMRWAGRGTLLLLLVATAWKAGVWLEGYVRRAPIFALKHIDIQGAQLTPELSLRRAAGLEPGDNVFSIDTAAVHQRVLAMAWIQDVQVERRLPDTVAIHVREHVPLALLVSERDQAVLSRDGAWIPLKPGSLTWDDVEPLMADLLVVSGATAGLEGLRRQRDRIARKLSRFEDAFVTSGLDKSLTVEGLALDGSGGLKATVKIGGGRHQEPNTIAVALGSPPFKAKFHRLERVLRRFKRQPDLLREVHLDNRRHPRRVTLTLAE